MPKKNNEHSALSLTREIEILRGLMHSAGEKNKPSIVASVSRELASLSSAQARLDSYELMAKSEVLAITKQKISLLVRISKKEGATIDAKKLRQSCQVAIRQAVNERNDALRKRTIKQSETNRS